MKALIIISVLILMPGFVFAQGACLPIGGECKNYCGPDELELKGTFIDCERQVCCVSEESLERIKRPSERAGETPSKGIPPEKIKPEKAEPEKTKPGEAKPEVPRGEVGRSTSGTADRILVCHPLKDTYALSDTPLKCGERTTTLKNLYEENYRLIQIIDGKRVLYYLERK